MGSAARGCLERAAGFGHARRRQRRDPPAERLPRDRVDVVEVDHAVGGDPVRWRQLELGCERSEEHTSELQSLMRSSYAVFCLKKKKSNYSHATTVSN